MRRSFLTAVVAVTALAFIGAALTPAEAQRRSKKKAFKKQQPRALTVRGRSFLNSGKHPLPGAEHRYVEMDTIHGRFPTVHQGDMFGSSLLSGPNGPFGAR